MPENLLATQQIVVELMFTFDLFPDCWLFEFRRILFTVSLPLLVSAQKHAKREYLSIIQLV